MHCVSRMPFTTIAFCIVVAVVINAARAEPEKPKAGSDPGVEAILAAQAFLRAVHASDDTGAYAMTTPTFRQGNSREQFAERLKSLRATNGVAERTPVNGWVVIKPADGKPRRALLAT